MPRTPRLVMLLGLLLCGTFAGRGVAQENAQNQDRTTAPGEVLLVAVKPAEPFVIEDPDGWEGISIELWRRVAEREGLQYDFEGTDLEGLLEGAASGRYAAALRPRPSPRKGNSRSTSPTPSTPADSGSRCRARAAACQSPRCSSA